MSEIKEKVLTDDELIVEYKKNRDLAEQYDMVQMAQKIALNSCYGSLGNKYARFYDLRLATSITMMGQLAIQYIAQRINDILNDVLKTDGEDYVAYIDTDSVHIKTDQIIKKELPAATDDEIIKYLAKLGKTLEDVTQSQLKKLGSHLNAKNPSALVMECEGISDKAIWTGKKRYVLRVVGDGDGKFPAPKEKIMGLEIKRSSTPDAVKPMLEKSIQLMLEGDINIFREYIRECRKEFFDMRPEDIAFPRGVSEITKYEGSTSLYKKGTPIAVRAAILYNNLIDTLGLTSKYTRMTDGGKIKFVYLLEPNVIHENVIGFNNSIPDEFDITEYVDYDKQFNKTFLEPVQSILECVGWELVETPTLF